MPLCFLRGLCYVPTKSLSELFFTWSPSLSHALSVLCLFSLFVVECALLLFVYCWIENVA